MIIVFDKILIEDENYSQVSLTKGWDKYGMVSDRIYRNSVWLHDEVCFIKCDEGFSTRKENIFIPEKLKNLCSFKSDCNRNNSIDT
jgi:hypothetical protein